MCKLLQVTIFQLEKIYGKGAEAKAFIEALIKGRWAALLPTSRAYV